MNTLLHCKFLPLRLGICRRWSSSWVLASQSTRSASRAFRAAPGLSSLPPALLATESLASRLLLGVGIDWLQRCSATAATRDCISADAVRPPRATVLLALVTSATREDIVRLLKGARAPSYKIPVRASNNRPRQGEDQGRGVAGSRNTSLRVSTVSTCNALRGLFWARQALPPPACGRAEMKGAASLRASPPLADGTKQLRPAPPPRSTANGRAGRAAGARIGTEAPTERPKAPLGLVGLVVVAGGSRTARYWAVWG